MNKRCQKCQYENNDEAKFCAGCGCKLVFEEPEMVEIPAGTFMMGCMGEKKIEKKGWFSTKTIWEGRDIIGTFRPSVDSPEKPIHEVMISKFYLSKFLVTGFEFLKFIEETGLGQEARWFDLTHPVVNVNWYEAQQYIAWLNEKTGQSYRLPTEAEWEYAASGGNYNYPFPWGTEEDLGRANFKHSTGRYIGKTTPVGSYKPNEYGLYDMHGNVYEWCQDFYKEDYYKYSPKIDPQGPETPDYADRRVTRGGCWKDSYLFMLTCSRKSMMPSLEVNNVRMNINIIGFRLALSVQ